MIRGRIVGVGQPFAGDDGAGPAVIALLRRSPLPPGIAVGEVREPTALLPWLDEPGLRLVIVDAVVAEPPGEVLDLSGEEIAARGLASVSSHGLSVGDLLALGRVLGAGGRPAADVRIVALAIARASRGSSALSPAVAASIPRAARLALARVTESGGV